MEQTRTLEDHRESTSDFLEGTKVLITDCMKAIGEAIETSNKDLNEIKTTIVGLAPD